MTASWRCDDIVRSEPGVYSLAVLLRGVEKVGLDYVSGVEVAAETVRECGAL